ncbi:MAG TPA: hypothetical protein VFV95_03315 [Vicinamibacterales bacterium]|nr:hypothetical protein [Vicinamibacterales bacterium]
MRNSWGFLTHARRLTACIAAAAALSSTAALAQQTHDPAEHQHDHGPGATLFPPRDASGTSWLPDDTPMYGLQRSLGAWTGMLHGSVFGQFLYEPGDRHRTGGFANDQFSSVNWVMGMARRPVAAGRLGLRMMASLEPWTVHNCGFINLLANGEVCEGDTIHDRQHPHDLFMELAADYDRPLTGTVRWQLYGGLAGEPALGPSGFPHRISAMPNPIAPVTHHWLDSSHVTFGLITTGVYERRWKAEVSLFNGREPDENRADLDLGPLDSIAGRLSLLPTGRWAIQVSGGHLRAAKAEFPPQSRSNVERATASVTYHRVTASTVWATTVAYGLDAGREVIPEGAVDLVTHAVLLESNLTLSERHAWFTRIEVVGKAGEDLHVHEAPAEVFTVAKMEGGYVRYSRAWKGIVAGAGGTASVNVVPPALAQRYSGRFAPGFGVFFTVRPARHAM